MLGMESRKVWVMAKLMMNTPITNGLVIYNSKAESDNIITDTKLTCMPGVKPVMMPINTPSNKEMIISKPFIMMRE